MVSAVVNQVLTSTTVTTTTETALITTSPYTYDFPNAYVGGEHSGAGQGIVVHGTININPAGTGATLATVRVRQGSLTGPVVGDPITQTIAATNQQEMAYWAQDTSRFCAQSGGGVYVITVQFTGATANSTVAYAICEVKGI